VDVLITVPSDAVAVGAAISVALILIVVALYIAQYADASN
jgi:hypothetical protein